MSHSASVTTTIDRIQDFDTTHIYNDAFAKSPNSLLEFVPITAPAPRVARNQPSDLYGGYLLAAPVLTAGDERGLFLKYNYAKFLLSLIQSQLRYNCADGLLAEGARLIDIIIRTRDTLIVHNLRLIVSRTPRHYKDYDDTISERNFTLIRCIDKFDIARNYKFSTYVVRSLMHNRNRFREVRKRCGDEYRILTKQDAQYEAYLEKQDARPDYRNEARTIETRDQANNLLRLFRFLNEKEAFVLKSRFGIDGHDELTLSQIGEKFGVSKERIRQLELRALESLRRYHAAEEENRKSTVGPHARADSQSNSEN